jgi:hypothetical protein
MPERAPTDEPCERLKQTCALYLRGVSACGETKLTGILTQLRASDPFTAPPGEPQLRRFFEEFTSSLGELTDTERCLLEYCIHCTLDAEIAWRREQAVRIESERLRASKDLDVAYYLSLQRSLLGSADTDLPIFVDAEIASDEFRMVRCSYLTIEAEDLVPDWRLDLNGKPVPVLLFLLGAIVAKPFNGDEDRFTTPRHFEDLWDVVESHQRLSVGTSDLWLPASLFRTRVAGDVYRASQRLFSVALDYRTGGMTSHDFVARTNDLREDLVYSEEETSAFREWNASVLTSRPRNKGQTRRGRRNE